MPPLTLNQAAKASKRSKATLLSAIDSGRLSASKDDLGRWAIDPSELFRVYPADQSTTGHENRDRPPEPTSQTNHLTTQVVMLQSQLEMLVQTAERERRTLETVISDLRADRDSWRRQAESLLTYQSPTSHENRDRPPEPAPAAPPAVEPERHPDRPAVRPVFVVLLLLLIALIATAMVWPPDELGHHLAELALRLRAIIATW